MSTCFHLVCHDTRQQLWVGQGHGGDMASLYMQPDHYARLHAFLRATCGKPLVLLSDHAIDGTDVETYEELDLMAPDAILATAPKDFDA